MSPRTAEENAKVKARTREKILECALRVFAVQGFHAATVSGIARAAGLSHGLLYHYFASKDDILLELAAVAFDSSLAVVKRAARGRGSAWDKIARITAMLFEHAIRGDSPYFFYLMVQAKLLAPAMPRLKALLDRRFGEYDEFFVPLIKRAQKEGKAARGDPAQLSASYWALAQGLALTALGAPEGVEFTNPDIIFNLLRRREQTHG